MSRPKNWYDMSDSERRAWQSAENDRQEMEYAKEEAERRASRAADDARRAQDAAKAARDEYEEQADSFREEIYNLKLMLTETRLERDSLLDACREALDLLNQPLPAGGLPTVPGETIADSLCALPVGGYRLRLALQAAISKAEGK